MHRVWQLAPFSFRAPSSLQYVAANADVATCAMPMAMACNAASCSWARRPGSVRAAVWCTRAGLQTVQRSRSTKLQGGCRACRLQWRASVLHRHRCTAHSHRSHTSQHHGQHVTAVPAHPGEGGDGAAAPFLLDHVAPQRVRSAADAATNFGDRVLLYVLFVFSLVLSRGGRGVYEKRNTSRLAIVSPSLTGVFIGGGHNKHGTGSRCTLPKQCRPPSPRRRWRCDRSSYKRNLFSRIRVRPVH